MTNTKITAWYDEETKEWLARKSVNGNIVKLVGGFSSKQEAEDAVR